MKPVRIAPPAAEELVEAVRWYESKREGLGAEFFDAVAHTIDLLRDHTELGTSVDRPYPHRQLLVDGFPYKVVYRNRVDVLHIIALAHASRRPGYWKQRR